MWFKQYGGWVIVGILAAVILYLIFRPVKSFDNKEAFKKIDSLTLENNNLRTQLTNFAYQGAIENEKLQHKNDSLRGRNDVLKFKNDVAYDQNVSLARQVQYYEAHQDTAAFDSACMLLAFKVISDSLVISDYQNNNELLINSFSEMINNRDSLITQQTKLILSDSILIRTQRDLTNTQQKQLKTATRRGKVTAWLARALAVSTGVLAIIVATK